MIKIQNSQLLSYPTGQIFSDNAISKIEYKLHDWFSVANAHFKADSPFIKSPSVKYNILENLTVGQQIYYNNLWEIGFYDQMSITIHSTDRLFFDIDRDETDVSYYYTLGFYGKNNESQAEIDFVPFYSFKDSVIYDTNNNPHQVQLTLTKNEDSSLLITTNILPAKAYINYGQSNQYTFIPYGMAIEIKNNEQHEVIKIENVGDFKLGEGESLLSIDDQFFSNVKLFIKDSDEGYVEYLSNRILSSWNDGRKRVEFTCIFDDYVDEDGVVVYRKKNGEFFKQGDKILLDAIGSTSRDLSFSNTIFEVVESTLYSDNGYKYISVVAIEYIPFINLRANGINYGTYREIIVSSDYENAVFDCESDGVSWTVENGGRLIALQLQSINKVINVQAHTTFGKIYSYQVIINTDTPLYVYTDYSGNQHDILWTQINSGGGNGGSGTIAT